jgi:hypothetical protein
VVNVEEGADYEEEEYDAYPQYHETTFEQEAEEDY